MLKNISFYRVDVPKNRSQQIIIEKWLVYTFKKIYKRTHKIIIFGKSLRHRKHLISLRLFFFNEGKFSVQLFCVFIARKKNLRAHVFIRSRERVSEWVNKRERKIYVRKKENNIYVMYRLALSATYLNVPWYFFIVADFFYSLGVENIETNECGIAIHQMIIFSHLKMLACLHVKT